MPSAVCAKGVRVYSPGMPLDVDAVVVSNTRLSNDYNVLALAAPAVASQAQPGQFVMVKAGIGDDPLLRRPFSVFEVLRDDARRVTGLSLLNKRVGVTTRMLFVLKPGDRVRCLGPLGRPFSVTEPPEQAWMVAGGVGLAPFATLAAALQERDVRTTPVLRWPERARPVSSRRVPAPWCQPRAGHRRWEPGRPRARHRPPRPGPR